MTELNEGKIDERIEALKYKKSKLSDQLSNLSRTDQAIVDAEIDGIEAQIEHLANVIEDN